MKTATPSRRERIQAQLVDLRLPGALEALDSVLSRADGGLSASEAIESLVGAQIMLRNNQRLQAAMHSSRLPAVKTLADFDFTFQPSIKREQIERVRTRKEKDQKDHGRGNGPANQRGARVCNLHPPLLSSFRPALTISNRLSYCTLVIAGLLSCRSSEHRGAAASFDRRPVSRDPVVLEGTVVDEDTGRPMPGVRVRLERSGNRGEASSDSTGRFRLRIDSAGLWAVEAQLDGYIAEKRQFHVSCGTGDWTVEGWSPAACPVPPASIVMRMRSIARTAASDTFVRGRVIDERTGQPLQALVMFDMTSGVVSSAQTGEYTLRGRAPGIHVLEARLLGYEDERRLVIITCAEGTAPCRAAGGRVNFWMRSWPDHP